MQSHHTELCGELELCMCAKRVAQNGLRQSGMNVLWMAHVSQSYACEVAQLMYGALMSAHRRTKLCKHLCRPTKETLAAMAKLIGQSSEGAKVKLRQIRKAAVSDAKQIPSEDDQKRAEKQVRPGDGLLHQPPSADMV